MTVAWAALLLLAGTAILVGAPVPPLQYETCDGAPQVCDTASPGLPEPGLITIGIGTWCLVAGLALVRRRSWARRAVVATLHPLGGRDDPRTATFVRDLTTLLDAPLDAPT